MSVVAADGFSASGIACGIKSAGELDVALVVADGTVPTAAVFTTNRAAAAPVWLSRQHLAAGSAMRAVVLNSGCANAATGTSGEAAALSMADAAASALGCNPAEVLVCSTGPIGEMLPVQAVAAGIQQAALVLGTDAASGTLAARAVMTTDTAVKEVTIKGPGFVVGGMAKGAGMIRPDMATMLAVLTTDAMIDAAALDQALREAVDVSFHSLNIDGCASTNDAVIVMASGASGVEVDASGFTPYLTSACKVLAQLIASDAEGAGRVITLDVRGAADDDTARRLGRAIADSALVRASFYGGDPNWGRIVGAMGATDLPFDPAAVAIAFAGVTVAELGVAAFHDEAGLLASIAEGDFDVAVVVGDGPGSASVVTTDLTPDYVRFNGERS